MQGLSRPVSACCAITNEEFKMIKSKLRSLRLLVLGSLGLGLVGASGAADVVAELVVASPADYARPHDIVLSADGNLLYLADNGNDRIAVLDPGTLRELGSFAHDEVSEPHDVAFDDQGQLLVADTGNSRIAIYEVNGTSGRLMGSLSGSIRRPEGVAVHPDGLVLATGASSGNVVAYRDGQVIAEAGGFSSPHDVEIDNSGAIWVVDSGNNRIVRLNAKLQIETEYSGAPYDFSGPRYIDFDDAGRLFVADKYTHSIKVLSPQGELLQVLGGPESGIGQGVFDRPEGVELRGRDIWFADTYNDRIVRYRLVDS